MKTLKDMLNEALMVESVKTGTPYEIDKLNDVDWKAFVKLVVKYVSEEEYDEEDILPALKGLIGDGLTLTDTDFSLETPKFDDDLYLFCKPINKYYSFEDRKWYNKKGK